MSSAHHIHTLTAKPASGRKTYRDGTHRVCHPEETLTNLAPFLFTAGISRLANVTGLDRIGIPVVMVVRPNAKSISVSQGKGTTLVAAKVSGMMEALEVFVAETADVTATRATLGSPPGDALVIAWKQLPLQSCGPSRPKGEIAWSLGSDLRSGEPIWAPAELVHMNYTFPQPNGAGWFFASSNGLASGNNTEEALVHALCEVIERDRRTRWASDKRARIGTRVNAVTIKDDRLQDLLELLENAGMDHGLWDLTGTIGIPVFLCSIRERDGAGRLSARVHSGSGCHPSREVAVCRAITEAAQMRLTYLTGARDDQGHDYFGPTSAQGSGLSTRHGAPGKDFDAVPSWVGDTPDEDLQFVLDRLYENGHRTVFSFRYPVDHVLDCEQAPFSVVRVVVPGLAGPVEAYNDHLLGPRRLL